MENDQDLFDWIRGLQRSEQPQIEKLREYFGRITTGILEHAENEIELARAIRDRESLVKHQIKMETVKTTRGIFDRGYQIATGREAWDEQDER